jgi:hypothetical protein
MNLRHTELSLNGVGLFLMPHPLFHPVNPVNPVEIQFFNGIAPAKSSSVNKFLTTRIQPGRCKAFGDMGVSPNRRTVGRDSSPDFIQRKLGRKNRVGAHNNMNFIA